MINGRMYRWLVICAGLVCLGSLTGRRLRADDVSGVFTYQSGTFAVISSAALDKPLGIDSSGDLLLATQGNIGGPVLLTAGAVVPTSLPTGTLDAYTISENGTVFADHSVNGDRTYFQI